MTPENSQDCMECGNQGQVNIGCLEELRVICPKCRGASASKKKLLEAITNSAGLVIVGRWNQ